MAENPKHIFDFESLLSVKADQRNWKQIRQKIESEFGELKFAINEVKAEGAARDVVDQLNKAFKKAKLPTITFEELEENLDEVTERFKQAFATINNIDTSALKGIETTLDHISTQVDQIVDKVGTGVQKAARKGIMGVEELDRTLQKLGGTKSIEEALSFSNKGGPKTQINAIKELGKEYSELTKEIEAMKTAGETVGDDLLVKQQELMVKYVRAYDEYMSRFAGKKKIPESKMLPSSEQSRYAELRPRAQDSEMNLRNLLDRWEGRYSDSDEPWAKEATLQQIKDILSKGITVKGGKGGSTKEPKDNTLQIKAKEVIKAAVQAVAEKHNDREINNIPLSKRTTELKEALLSRVTIPETANSDDVENLITHLTTYASDKKDLSEVVSQLLKLATVIDGVNVGETLSSKPKETVSEVVSDTVDIAWEKLEAVIEDIVEEAKKKTGYSKEQFENLEGFTGYQDRIVYGTNDEDIIGNFESTLSEYAVGEAAFNDLKEYLLQVMPTIDGKSIEDIVSPGSSTQRSSQPPVGSASIDEGALKRVLQEIVYKVKFEGQGSAEGAQNPEVINALVEALKGNIKIAPDNEGLVNEIKTLIPLLGTQVGQEETLKAIEALLKNSVPQGEAAGDKPAQKPQPPKPEKNESAQVQKAVSEELQKVINSIGAKVAQDETLENAIEKASAGEFKPADLLKVIDGITVTSDNEELASEMKTLVQRLGNSVAQEGTLETIASILKGDVGSTDEPISKAPPQVIQKAETIVDSSDSSASSLVDSVDETGGANSNLLQQLEHDAEAASRAFYEANDRLSDIIGAERKLDEQIANANLVDYAKKIKSVEQARSDALSALRQNLPKKAAHKDNAVNIQSVVQGLIDDGALPGVQKPTELYAVEKYLDAVADYSKHTNNELNQLLERVLAEVKRKTDETVGNLKIEQFRQDSQDDRGLLARRKKMAEDHAAAVKTYNDAADTQAEAYRKLHEAQERLNQAEAQNPQTSDVIKQETLSYDELINKIEAYIKIRQQMQSLMKQNQPWQHLMPEVDRAKKDITSLFPETGDKTTITANMVGNMLQNRSINESHIKQLADALGIEIPQAVQQAEQAIDGLNTELKETEQGATTAGAALESEKPEQGDKKASGSILTQIKGVLDQIYGEFNKTTVDENADVITTEKLKNLLSSIIYNVKIAHDDTDKQSNKIAVDENALKTTLQTVFQGILTPKDTTENNKIVELLGAISEKIGSVGQEETLKPILSSLQADAGGEKEEQNKVAIDEEALTRVLNSIEYNVRVQDVKGVLEKIAANTASLNGVEIQRAVEANTAATEQVAPAVAQEVAATTEATGPKVAKVKTVKKEGVLERKDTTRRHKTDEADFTEIDTVLYGEDPTGQQTETHIKTIIQDFEKLAKEAEKTEKTVERAKAKVKLFLSTIQNTTQGQGTFIEGYNELSAFSESGNIDVDNMSAVLNMMDSIKEKYNELTRLFRKGKGSLNPFVNAINDSRKIGGVFGDIKEEFDGLTLKSDSIKKNFEELQRLFNQIQGLLLRKDSDPGNFGPADFRELANSMGDFTVIKGEFDHALKKDTKRNDDLEKLLKMYEKLGQLEAEQGEESAVKAKKQQEEIDGLITKLGLKKEELQLSQSSLGHSLQEEFDQRRRDGFAAGQERERAKARDDERRELEKLYHQLGEAYAVQLHENSEAHQREIDKLEEKIKLQRELLGLSGTDDLSNDTFLNALRTKDADLEAESKDKTRSERIKQLEGYYKELGTLAARHMELSFDDPLGKVLEGHIDELRSKITSEISSLQLSEDDIKPLQNLEFEAFRKKWSKLEEDEAKRRANSIEKLKSLYEQLGAAEANVAHENSDRNQREIEKIEDKIKLLRKELDLKDEDLGPYKTIAANARVSRTRDIEADTKTKDRKEKFDELRKMAEEYGALMARLSKLDKDSSEAIELNKQADAISRKVEEQSELLGLLDREQEELENINAKAFDKKTDELNQSDARRSDRQREVERAGQVKDLNELYEKLGKAEAEEASMGENDPVREEKEKQIAAIKAKIEAQKEEIKTIKELTAEELASAEAIRKGAQGDQAQKIAEREAKKERTRQRQEAKRRAMSGKAGSAIGRAESVWMEASGLDVEIPEELSGKIDELRRKYEALIKEQTTLNSSTVISEEQIKSLQKATTEVNDLTGEIGPLLAQYQKLSGDNVEVLGASSLGSTSNIEAYKIALTQAVMAATDGKARITGFNAATKELTYTLDTGAHETTEFTAATRELDQQLVSVRGNTKRTETFFESMKRKMKEISSYMSGMSLISRAGQEIRKGIQYVREIDLALTELKKVTDETKETYDSFLETAAKTGARLGTTISAVTEATATFAKLGYSMSQATEMAEAAIVYKNVGDNITSAEDAADSIISTMKGFGLEASESMAIVDRFNEVGNRFAITSQGIGEALRLSASALSEGSNSLDESIALITAANEVVNDPSSVGTALKTLTLRLRGSKTE